MDERCKMQADRYLEKKEYKLASELYFTAISINPEVAAHYESYIPVLLELEEHPEVVESCEKLLSLDNKNQIAIKGLARSLQYLGEFENSKEYCEEYLKRPHDDNEFIRQINRKNSEIIPKLRKCFSEKTLEATLKTMKELIGEFKDSSDFKKCKIEILKIYQQDVPEEFCDQIIKDHGPVPEAIMLKATYLLKDSKTIPKAIKLLNEANFCYPENQQVESLFIELKDFIEMSEKFSNFDKKLDDQSAINVVSDYLAKLEKQSLVRFAALEFSAEAYFKKNEYLLCIEQINKALSISGEQVKLLTLKGLAYYNLQNFDEFYSLFVALEDEKGKSPIIEQYLNYHNEGIKAPRDFYKVLGVNKTDTPENFKKAYLQKMKRWAPEKNLQLSEENEKQARIVFEKITLAYHILSDSEKKETFEAVGDQSGIFDYEFDPVIVFEEFKKTLTESEKNILTPVARLQ